MTGELLLDGGDDELLHFLVRLGDQVNRRALQHDADVFLQSLADHLGGNTWMVISEEYCLAFNLLINLFISLVVFNFEI